VLAHDRDATLWDAARLLSVGEEGYSYRRSVGARVRALPELKEIAQFFTAELAAQLADARSPTTAKLDAPVNKLARLLNSPSIKRVLLNDSLRVDFDRVIAGQEVLVVKGALGSMGAGNTSVLMQLLVGMLDAALARQQDLVTEERRVAVALKVDEAPLVLNRGFAETIALKRSAGLETVACWQADAQWTDREVRAQLDALFAHRVYFATASAGDARDAVALTMAAYSDTVRPGIAQLSALGRPDVRLHLPKHHAIASWSTPEGRQAPFIARTIPLQVDRERIALHAASQSARGGRHLMDLRQPHWDGRQRARASERARASATAADTPLVPASPSPAVHELPSTAAESFGELVELDAAHSVRWARRAGVPRGLEPDQLDLDILGLIASLRHVLTSQIHRRFNAGRAVTTTQRRLKRLSDAGLVERFQFHRRDGGGVPMCYVITAEGIACIRSRQTDDPREQPAEPEPGVTAVPRRSGGQAHLRQARRDVHVAGWALALERAISGAGARLRGPGESVLSPSGWGSDARTGLSLVDLRLPGGRAPHDFLRTDAGGSTVEVERFETVRPNAIVELSRELCDEGASSPGNVRAGAVPTLDVLVEFDDRLPEGLTARKLERYDHFLTGWSAHTRRYGQRLEAIPVVVFVCRDRSRARACARAADSTLRACQAYAGEYPFDWQYPARERIVFASERDVHEGMLNAYGVPRLPPEVRVSAAHGDPRAAEASTEQKSIAGLAG
jgi:hypothetical protein